MVKPEVFMSHRDLVSAKSLTREEIELLIDKISEVKRDPKSYRDKLLGKTVALLFFEPSTRTYTSFSVAAQLLGCKVTGFLQPSSSSIAKGENFHDTIKMYDAYSDCIVIRHDRMGSARYAAEIASSPVINAGSGAQEHPTQALLDVFTIMECHGRIDGLHVGILGDLKYGRTVSSLAYVLSNFNVDISFISPEMLQLRPEVEFFLRRKGVRFKKFKDLKSVIGDLDVLYVTRIQKERFPDPTEYEKVKGAYRVDSSMLEIGKPSLIVMHPLPRVDEISHDVDKMTQAKYFEQAENGLYTRIALLDIILGEEFG